MCVNTKSVHPVHHVHSLRQAKNKIKKPATLDEFLHWGLLDQFLHIEGMLDQFCIGGLLDQFLCIGGGCWINSCALGAAVGSILVHWGLLDQFLCIGELLDQLCTGGCWINMHLRAV